MALLKAYRSVVIGAGPSGLAALANLLDAGVDPVLWVDPSFRSGRLSNYCLVPSNTKVQLFLDFALASPTLSHVASSGRFPALDHLRAMDPGGTCLLKHTVHMISQLSSGVRHHFSDRVHFFQGWAVDVVRQGHNDQLRTWSIGLCDSESGFREQVAENAHPIRRVDAPSIIFATGSHPIPVQHSWAPHILYGPAERKIQELILETALDPAALSTSVSSSDVVAVVGNSHSAVLCLKNLSELTNRPLKILHYYRDKLKYAVYMDGWILYDNTGLKGDAAVWAKQMLETGSIPNLESHFLRDPCRTEAEVYKNSMHEVTKIIYAIGFQRNRLPKLLLDGAGSDAEITEKNVKYDERSGKLRDPRGKDIPGLWGCGIAFPEETVDPQGNREHAVGLWKFMRFLKKTIHDNVVPEVQKLAQV